ncbi:DNA polymerase III subunit epsilon, partial [Xanthobacter autotrophicus]|nr:DNA polymerase III subunit epsilon [Xanthobacter autotrophicus]
MTFNRRLALTVLAPGIGLAAWLLLGLGLLYAALDPADRAAVAATLAPLIDSHGMLVVLWWFLAATGGGILAARLHDACVEAPARLADATRV